MIEQIFYASGVSFFILASFLLVKCYIAARRMQFLYNKMETSITLPNISQEASVDNVECYRQRLVKARVKTADDLSKISDEEVKKLYLKHEQSVDRKSVV